MELESPASAAGGPYFEKLEQTGTLVTIKYNTQYTT